MYIKLSKNQTKISGIKTIYVHPQSFRRICIFMAGVKMVKNNVTSNFGARILSFLKYPQKNILFS
jgi:hypothetical protein